MEALSLPHILDLRGKLGPTLTYSTSHFDNYLTIIIFSAINIFARFMYIFFCGIMPCMAISAFLVYYLKQQNSAFHKRKPVNPYVKQSNDSNVVVAHCTSSTSKKLTIDSMTFVSSTNPNLSMYI